jgi:hypothetical protein
MRKRFVLLIAILALVAAACGGGSDEATTEPTSATTTTASSATGETAATTQAPVDEEEQNTGGSSGGDSDYCTEAQQDQTFEGFDVFSDDLESEVTKLLDQMAEAEANAPSEIRDDVKVLFDAFRGLAEILAEYEYDLFAIPPDDPRFTELDTPEITKASENIAAYCGIDLDTVGNDGSTGSGTGSGSGAFIVGDDELPADFPEALIPPSLEGVSDNGSAGLLLGSSAPFDEVVAFYVELLGDPSVEDAETATFSGQVDGQMVFVNVVLTDDYTIITILSF